MGSCATMALICIPTIIIGILTGVILADKYLIGVHPDRRSLYGNVEQNFRCLDGSRTIPIQFVNDDYCDCQDASDEPGTSACPNGQFYCANEGYLQKLIPSAWVNDGQCDCCDTSDEYNSNVTCENTCGVLGEIYRQEQERNREISDRGSALRSQYKEQARLRREQNSQLLEQYKRELSEKENAIKNIEEEINSDFGPASVYYPLKGQCFNYKDREYTYTLCPFGRASQDSVSGMQTELGRWSGWLGSSENPYMRQKYEGGIQCWNGPARSAIVNIGCGVEDKIVSVTEPAKCEYVYEFITPAACPDLDPPEEQRNTEQPSATSMSESNEQPMHESEGDQDQGAEDHEVEEDHPNLEETHDEL